ncbi:MAG: SPFH/Band 7/PHB domain protein [Gammaproteobacteria bacterium]|nr:SPFH/Band 7/PHB domain protein [Gammaproteobacteria bacterium]MDD9824270.1 SPFH/Band 7/PHB domain protein [Gammaproteobacteria bacterium]MDD9863948.1 SPFH/Band 7/PHB domain protein [Gammaproteobacteria bacterium]
MQGAFLLVSFAVFVLILVAVANGIRTVPQGEEWVVERFGKYRRTLPPGLSFIVPFFDRVAYKLVTKDIVLDVDRQEVITKDNAVIHTNAVAFIKVTDPMAAVYGVVDFALAVRNLVQTSLRSIIGGMSLDEALSSREQIKASLRNLLASDMQDWGITLKSVEIQDIKPSESMQQAMEQQAAAERERKAMVTRAEGAKQSAILEAEGRLESAKRDAKAEVTLAEASKLAINLIRETTDSPELPLTYLLGQRYIRALKELSESANGKFVVLPADFQEAIKGMLAGRGK